MSVTNEEVIKNFAKGRVGYDGFGNVSSEWHQNNKVLLSYDAVIATWDFSEDRNSYIVIFNEWDGFSPTTSRHVNMLRNHLDDYNEEVEEKYEEWR